MSIALSTLVLFFLLIPGIVFRRFYYSEEFSKEYFKQTFFGVFISTIIPSLVFQYIWFVAFGTKVDLYILGDLVSQEPMNESFENLQSNASNIFWYNSSLFFSAGFLGYLSKKVIRKFKLDRTYKFFRFQNSWHYILQGEIFDFPKSRVKLERDTVEEIEFIFIDVLIEVCGVAYIYDGFLLDYELSHDGGLETISLFQNQRRKLSDDSIELPDGNVEENSSKYYTIKGHFLVIRYAEIKNLNVTYLKVSVDENGLVSPSEVE